MNGGFINVLKPPGMTSHDVVGKARRIFQTRRIGHAGTLDPGAAGVLPLAVGEAARLVEYLADLGKSYRLELCFGYETDTGDETGHVVRKLDGDFALPSPAHIQEALHAMTGDIYQRPPAYSAVKVHGVRAYKLAREQQAVTLPARLVHIHSLRVYACEEKLLRLDVDCSKGTYVRSLCRDLGERLGIPATMGFLLRTRAGAFTLSEAHTLEELETLREQAFIPASKALAHLPSYTLAANRKQAFFNGLATSVRKDLPDKPLRIECAGAFLGIGRYDPQIHSILPVKAFRD